MAWKTPSPEDTQQLKDVRKQNAAAQSGRIAIAYEQTEPVAVAVRHGRPQPELYPGAEPKAPEQIPPTAS